MKLIFILVLTIELLTEGILSLATKSNTASANSNSNSNKIKSNTISNSHNSLKKSEKFESSFTMKTKLKSLFSINLNNASTDKLTNSIFSQGKQNFPVITADDKMDIGLGPIYYQGWNKFFINTGNDQNKKFKINSSYSQKNLNNTDPNINTDLNNINIPSENQFYFIVTDTTLNVLTSRHVSNY